MKTLTNVSSKYGAPMGRYSTHGDKDAPVKFHLCYVPFVDGCYDRGGAYWGGPADLWHVYCTEGNVEFFLRARNRTDAKGQVREDYPNARFFR
jgi:hypothetical protein